MILLHDNSHQNIPIPTGAFTNFKKLKLLYITNEQFSRISSNAFNVDNITVIEISSTNISVIEDNAFFSQKTLDNNLILKLRKNPLLRGDSFTDKAFSNIHKPTELDRILTAMTFPMIILKIIQFP